MNEKVSLFNYCLDYVEERIARIQTEINSAQLSANQETKSSAGDKYETGRAMAQLDIERNMFQLKEAEKLRSILRNLPKTTVANMVVPGALVITNKGKFFLAISIGTVKLNGEPYFIISADSPIGKLLLGKQQGSTFNWNNTEYKISEIR